MLYPFRMTVSCQYVMASVSEPFVTHEIYTYSNLFNVGLLINIEKIIETNRTINFVLNRFFSRYAPSEQI